LKVMSGKKIWFLALFLLAWAVIATIATSYYYMQYTKYNDLYQDISKKLGEVSISINLAIDYGNTTRVWYNETVLQIGATLYNATVKVAKIETHPLYPGYVTTIDGVKENLSEEVYWLWWYWEETERKWTFGPVGFNEYTLHDKQTLIWYYSNGATPP